MTTPTDDPGPMYGPPFAAALDFARETLLNPHSPACFWKHPLQAARMVLGTLVNYLLLLGWSLDDKTELFTRDEMIKHFSFERVNKAPASFDPPKLLAFQEHYMQELSAAEKHALSHRGAAARAMAAYLREEGW